MFIISVLILLGMFILNLLFGIKYGFGFRHYWFFELLHFLSGFFLAMFFASFLDSKVLIFTGIAIVSFLWETTEYLIGKVSKLSIGFKKIFNLKNNVNTRTELLDTILDIILNFSGAAIFVYLFL